jgi:hypothetical protein
LISAKKNSFSLNISKSGHPDRRPSSLQPNTEASPGSNRNDIDQLSRNLNLLTPMPP